MLYCCKHRWFYFEPNKFWKPFSGYDSLKLEDAHLHLLSQHSISPDIVSTEVEVMGNMFVVNLQVEGSSYLFPIYWTSML